MKPINTISLINSDIKHFTDILNILKNKILNQNVTLNNLDNKRKNFELLIDYFIGSIAEYISKNEIVKNLNKEFTIIDYDLVRSDNNLYPDLFDLIICKSDDKHEILNILNERLLDFKRIDETKIGLEIWKKSKLLKELSIKYDFKTVEIKSSKFKEVKFINDKSFIVYCQDKYFKNIDTLLNINVSNYNRDNDIFWKYNFSDYLDKKYPYLNNFNEKKDKYLKENINLKNIHCNVFYNDFKEKKHYENIDIKNIQLNNIISYLPNIFYDGKITNDENILLKNSKIGVTNKKLDAIYHLNKIFDIGFDYNLINKLINNKNLKNNDLIYDF